LFIAHAFVATKGNKVRTNVPLVPEIIFAPGQTSSSSTTKAERKAFLVSYPQFIFEASCFARYALADTFIAQNGSSAKMMGIKVEPDFVPKRNKRARDDEGEEPEDQ